MHEHFDKHSPHPVTLDECLGVIQQAQLVPGVSYSVVYTLRMLVHQFFRDDERIAECADDKLSVMYSDAAPYEDTTEPDFPRSSFVISSNTGPSSDDIISGPQKIHCD